MKYLKLSIKKIIVGGIFCNLKKAFDSVDHASSIFQYFATNNLQFALLLYKYYIPQKKAHFTTSSNTSIKGNQPTVLGLLVMKLTNINNKKIIIYHAIYGWVRSASCCYLHFIQTGVGRGMAAMKVMMFTGMRQCTIMIFYTLKPNIILASPISYLTFTVYTFQAFYLLHYMNILICESWDSKLEIKL